MKLYGKGVSLRLKFVRWILIVWILPLVLALTLFWDIGFAFVPSTRVIELSKWASVIFAPFLIISFLMLFFCKDKIEGGNGEPINKKLFLIWCPILGLGMPFLYFYAFQFNVGNVLHIISEKKKCHFIAQLEKSKSSGRRGTRYYLEIKKAKKIALNWRISEKEFSTLPHSFWAVMDVTQSNFGLKI